MKENSENLPRNIFIHTSEPDPSVIKIEDPFAIKLEEKIANQRTQTPMENVPGEVAWGPESLAVLTRCQDVVNKLLSKYGIDQIDISHIRIHQIQSDEYDTFEERYRPDKIKTTAGLAFPANQEIGLRIPKDQSEITINQARTIIHELLHLVSAQRYRHGKLHGRGMNTLVKKDHDSPNGAMEYVFTGLDEAVIESAAELLLFEVLTPEELRHVQYWNTDIQIAKGCRNDAQKWQEVFPTLSIEEKISTLGHRVYEKQQQVLWFVCQEISKKFPSEYPTSDTVFNDFLETVIARSSLTRVGLLVERTFGKGSFRILSKMTEDTDDNINVSEIIESLKAQSL